MELIDADDLFDIYWDGCDIVVETLIVFWTDLVEGQENNWKHLELTVEDRLCETDLTHFGAINYRFSATTLEEDDFPLRNP